MDLPLYHRESSTLSVITRLFDDKELSKVDMPSFFNVKECEAIVEIKRALLSSRNISVNTDHIFVITCFRLQVLILREAYMNHLELVSGFRKICLLAEVIYQSEHINL